MTVTNLYTSATPTDKKDEKKKAATPQSSSSSSSPAPLPTHPLSWISWATTNTYVIVAVVIAALLILLGVVYYFFGSILFAGGNDMAGLYEPSVSIPSPTSGPRRDLLSYVSRPEYMDPVASV